MHCFLYFACYYLWSSIMMEKFMYECYNEYVEEIDKL